LFVIPAAAASNQPPTAAATASPTSGAAPLVVSFDGRGSFDSDGTISSYSWAFGDGTMGIGSTVSHAYNSVGTFTATLTVTDNAGASAAITLSIQVSPEPPVVVNAPSNLSGSVSGRTVSLTWVDNSTNEDGFYVERSVKGTGVFAQVGQTGAGVAGFSQTVSRGTYLYRVRAFGGAALSAYSNNLQLKVR
jgi:PKD repeat protein